MSVRAETIYESTYRELRNTLHERLKAHRELNQRAIDLAKIDLLSVSVLVSGIALSGELHDALVYFTAGVLSLLYSLWHCIHVYRLRHFARGIAAEAADEVAENVATGVSVASHYRNLVDSFQRAIVSFRRTYRDEVGHFQSALWASITSIMFLVGAAVRVALPSYPRILDVPMLVVIPALSLWGRDKYGAGTVDYDD